MTERLKTWAADGENQVSNKIQTTFLFIMLSKPGRSVMI